jgi:type II secretory ATPase GspE/PulE/Tfp pilus assembly ATPase PilB-like protein
MLRRLQSPEPAHANAIAVVDEILDLAIARGASDIHFEPTADGAEVRFRIDGLLELHAQYDSVAGRSLVTRLMVMAHLLTYRLDVPQEGRLRFSSRAAESPLELRLAIMPTTHGLRAALRMPAELIQPKALEDLGLPAPVLAGLLRFASADSGMLIVTGPAGSGKTTTLYALLEHLARSVRGLSIVSLEDPVERDIPGVTQIEISPFGQLTYERALRSMLRQDPQVLMLGEIRDAQTASLAAQAALSGHRLVCTLHASSPASAFARLLEMGLEPYRITSAVHGVIAQRLLRRVDHSQRGYRGRVPAAEFVPMSPPLRAAILAGADAAQLQQIAAADSAHQSLRQSAEALVVRNITDAAEVDRVLGPSEAAP